MPPMITAEKTSSPKETAGNSQPVRKIVALTNLDQSLFDGAGVTKRDLVDYLDAMADPVFTELVQRIRKHFFTQSSLD